MSFRCLWTSKIGPDQGRCKEQCVTCAIYSKGNRMDFDTYLYEARKTAIYPPDRSLEYLTLGLASEAGEVAGKIKKWIRDELGQNDDHPIAELGDVLWYLVMLADELGYSLQEVAEKNLEKLRDRQERGVISGSGDER